MRLNHARRVCRNTKMAGLLPTAELPLILPSLIEFGRLLRCRSMQFTIVEFNDKRHTRRTSELAHEPHTRRTSELAHACLPY
jgi:hypothetical protein